MPKGKQPALMLYTGDWLKDPELSACSPSTRGIWADWLCRMREQVAAGRRPRLAASVEAFARLGRCSADEAFKALVELQETDAASVTMSRDVTLRHADVTDVVTLENRRMSREWKASHRAAERQRDKRERDAVSRKCHANVTLPSSSSSSSSSSRRRKRGGEDTSSATLSADGDVALDPAEVAIWLPVVKGKKSGDALRIRISPETGDFEEWAVLGTDVESFQAAYPDLNIQSELMKAAAWLKSNKPKRKTPTGIPRFLNGWMDRAQNRTDPRPGGRSAASWRDNPTGAGGARPDNEDPLEFT